jgi:hypothetical protein
MSWKGPVALARVLMRAGLYVILILLCVLMAPDDPVRFIYTGF